MSGGAAPQCEGRVCTMEVPGSVKARYMEGKRELEDAERDEERARADLAKSQAKLDEAQAELKSKVAELEQRNQELRQAMYGQGGTMEALTEVENMIDDLEMTQVWGDLGVQSAKLGLDSVSALANLNPVAKLFVVAASMGVDYIGGASVQDLATGWATGQIKGDAIGAASKYVGYDLGKIDDLKTILGYAGATQQQATSLLTSGVGSLTSQGVVDLQKALTSDQTRIQKLFGGRSTEEINEMFGTLHERVLNQEYAADSVKSAEFWVDQRTKDVEMAQRQVDRDQERVDDAERRQEEAKQKMARAEASADAWVARK